MGRVEMEIPRTCESHKERDRAGHRTCWRKLLVHLTECGCALQIVTILRNLKGKG